MLDADSGKIVGLLSQGSAPGRFDRYIPLQRLVEAGTLLRLPWLVDGDDAEGHFTRRSRGRRGGGGRDVFTGRTAALAEIREGLTSPESTRRPLVVAGQPGAGKSTVIARAALDVAAEMRDEPLWRGLLFHARAEKASGFLHSVAELFGADTDESHHALMDEVDRIGESSTERRWVIVVDGLDEAPQPEDRADIAALVVDLARRPWIRAVVATRPMSASGPLGHDSLLRKLAVQSEDDECLINLDDDFFFEQIDAENLAVRLLRQDDQKYQRTGAAAEAYRANPALAQRLARVVAQTARRNFLVCAMTAGNLAELLEVMDPHTAEFDISALPTTVGEALERFLGGHPAGAPLRQLLTVLAYAEGAGMDDGTWLASVSGLGYSAAQANIDELRNSPVADYLLWNVPALVDTGIDCPDFREFQIWVRHAVASPRSTRLKPLIS